MLDHVRHDRADQDGAALDGGGFDPARIGRLLDARRDGHSLPQPFYKDADVYAFDLVAIHARSWILLGFEIEWPAPGAYLATQIGETPIVVVRDRDGVLKGYHNACRHRGAKICADGTGRKNRLVCPYHQWTYDFSGKLVHAGRMADGFDPAEHGLRPIHVETVAGTVYVCIAEAAPDFAPFKAAFEPLLAPHDLGNAKLAYQSTLVEKANWKLVMENARECYHCAVGHPELSLTFPVGTSKHFDYADDSLERFNARMAEVALPVGPVEDDWWQAMRFPLNKGCVSMTMDGQPCVKRPMVDRAGGDIGSLRWALEPHSFAHAVSDHLFLFSAMPTGPQETLVTAKWLVHKDAVEGVDYNVDELADLWTRTNFQDRDLAENNQQGVNGLGYVPGPYSEDAEALVRRFVDWYCRKARAFVDEAGA